MPRSTKAECTQCYVKASPNTEMSSVTFDKNISTERQKFLDTVTKTFWGMTNFRIPV